jgi:hypothetical protein
MKLFDSLPWVLDVLERLEHEGSPHRFSRETGVVEIQNHVYAWPASHVSTKVLLARKEGSQVGEAFLPRHLKSAELEDGFQDGKSGGDDLYELSD